jgi:hypothetical protein
MATKLSLEEQEVHFSMSADDPGTWYVYTDYPKWQRKLEAAGATLVREEPDRLGRHYTLPAKQLSLRRPAKPLSEERKAELVLKLHPQPTTPRILGTE